MIRLDTLEKNSFLENRLVPVYGSFHVYSIHPFVNPLIRQETDTMATLCVRLHPEQSHLFAVACHVKKKVTNGVVSVWCSGHKHDAKFVHDT